MHKIIISISELNKSNWITLYKFINNFYENNLQQEIFQDLQRVSIIMKTNKAIDKDAYSAYGEELTYNNIPHPASTVFSIIYTKQNDAEDLSDLIPFILIEQKFAKKITLGIDLAKITSTIKQSVYTFKCSDFFQFMQFQKPVSGKRTIYFINLKTVDKETGEIKHFSFNGITSLIGKGKLFNNSELKEQNISRRFLPVLNINEKTYSELFTNTATITEEAYYIKQSIKKLSKELKKKGFSDHHEIYTSIFEEWFIKAYFNSLDKPFEEMENYEGLKYILHTYCINIFELIQNVIFHGGKLGLAYFVFNKKENISKSQQRNIIGFEKYDNQNRFVEIGIFDYNEQGIVSNYVSSIQKKGLIEKKRNEDVKIDNISTKAFFDINSTLTTGLNHLELRYTAHMGIKSFVKTVLKNNGYFSVESNLGINKQRVESTFLIEKDKVSYHLQQIDVNEFVSGTHYEIILPVLLPDTLPTSDNQPQTQKKSFIRKLKNRIKQQKSTIKTIILAEILEKKAFEFTNPLFKDIQIQYIKSIGDEILNEITKDHTIEELSINLRNTQLDTKFIFKLLSYIQLSHETTFKKIILTGLSNQKIDEFCETIDDFLINPGIEPIWSNQSALILVSSELRYQIICGESTNEIYYLNNEYQKYYFPHHNFFKSLPHKPLDLSKKNELDEYLLPYEVLIERDKCSYFEQYALEILKTPIESDKMGYLVNHINTYIGSKLIIKNYYEADSMFQNSFFAERFAYLIARDIQLNECLSKKVNKDEKVAIVGYKSYSGLLVKTIEKLIEKSIETVIIANEENEGEAIKFDFDKSKKINGSSIEDCIKTNPFNYKFIVVVPIGSTLTTNDKIIAFLKLFINISDKNYSINNFIYNHCAIVVRDKIGNQPTKIECVQKWDEKWTQISSEKIIKTKFENAKTIHFTIQISDKINCHNWLPRLNKEVSFPAEWQNEQYVNFTENSSINSQNLMGYPKVNKSRQSTEYDHEKELNRLRELKDDIYFGHIECHKSHYRYYIDTETYIRRNKKDKFDEWVKEITKKHFLDEDDINVLITPNAKIKTDFIEAVNEKFFNGNALIIYLDVHNWRNNIIHKLSYLRQLYETRKTILKFHYVDHALFTSETYKKAKSYMLSILQDDLNEFSFTSIITLINRLSFDRDREIRKDVKNNLYAYLNLFIPPNKDPEKDCSLCLLFKHYKRIKRNTVLESCNNAISDNLYKIEIRPFGNSNEHIEEKENYSKLLPQLIDDRKFIRMLFIHEIFYTISSIEQDPKIENKEQKIAQELDKLYNGEQLTSLDKWHNEEIVYWEENIREYIDEKFIIDKEISFLKVMSSPPLSQYIKIRKYAHGKLLEALYAILPYQNDNKQFVFKKKTHAFDDLRKLKVILKSLSFLKSNALVRKEVITGVWALCFHIISQLPEEANKLKNIRNALKNEKKKLIYKPNEKIIESIERDIDEQLKIINKDRLELIREFKSSFQFFVKNAVFEDETKAMYLGELLRTGEEITNFDKPVINKTRLALNNNSIKLKYENPLFDISFDDLNVTSTDIKEYKIFLVWLFYDNTTIIRKSLQNFEKELNKDSSLKSFFFNEKEELIDFNKFKREIDSIKAHFKNKVEKEYYYSNFRNYLKNPDKIDFIEKLIYILYAQEKINKINTEKRKKGIDTDTKSLLEIFVAIMGADAAFFSMKEKKDNSDSDSYEKIYPVSVYGNDKVPKADRWDYDNWIFDEDFYTGRILIQKNEAEFKKFSLPIILRSHLCNRKKNDHITFKEKEFFKAERLNILLITNPQIISDHQTDLVATITFLYNDKINENDFRIHSQELGRLLLLLKNDLNQYVINYLLDEKVFDLWLEERKRYHLYKLPDHNYYNNLAELKLALESHDYNKLDWLYRMVFNKIDLRNYLISDDKSMFEPININIKEEVANYCEVIFNRYLNNFVTLDIKEDLNIMFSEEIFKEIMSEYLLNISRVLRNGLPSCCKKECEIIIEAIEESENIKFTLSNDFFLSKQNRAIIDEINNCGHVNGKKKEKGLSFNERLLSKIGSDKPKIIPKIISEEKQLGKFIVIFNIKKNGNN